MKKLFDWFDNNILGLLAGFLLVFIPLYPKVPLFDIIPGYIVRIRLEDLLISFTIFIWLILLVRKKITLKDNPLFKPIALYLIFGLLSVLTAIFVVHTVPLQKLHIEKIVLHYIRRIEYFSLFFIFFSSIKSFRQVKIYLTLFIITVLSVTIYGYGQKYFYWPAFSTMNREFSKGFMLYLGPHGRVLSTFGGHYDLAAFTMIGLLILWSIFFSIKNKIAKLATFLIICGAFWLLILTASRISFLAYLGGLVFLFFLWAYKKGVGWALGRYLMVSALSILIMMSFGDLGDRFNKLLRLNERLSGIRDLVLKPAVAPPSQKSVFLVNNISDIASKSDQPPVTDKNVATRPSDVESDIPLTTTTIVNGKKITVTKKRTYSETAFTYDLSTAIRFDALWPRAIQGFLRSPLLGSGYSTLTKERVEEFTDAESTDNDYLRALGETGLLGTMAFFGIIGVTLMIIWKSLAGITDSYFYAFLIGVSGAIFGLLINATYIDVFEASKVAFPFWSLIGITLGAINVTKAEIDKHRKPMFLEFHFRDNLRKFFGFFRTDVFIILVICSLAFILRTYKLDNPIADWHSWRQADTSAVTRNFERYGINFLYPIYDDLSSIASGKPNPNGYRMVEFPIYNAISVTVRKIIPEGPLERTERLVSILFSLGTIVFLFLLTRKYIGRGVGILTAFIYAVLPYNLFYNRVILPDPFMVFTSLGFIYFFDKWLDHGKFRNYLISLIFSMISLLAKPYAVFFYLPLLYLLWKKWGIKSLFNPFVIIYFILSVIPFFWWRGWISHFPEGIPASEWLLNGNGIRFKGAFFNWIFADRISREILGFWGVVFLVFGILGKLKEKEGLLFHFLGLSSLLYLFTFATGNVQHDYYQILIIPAICVFVAKGIASVYEYTKNSNRYLGLALILVVFAFMESFGWYQIRDLFNINHPEIVEAGVALDKVAPRKALVIAPYGGDTAFLYQTNRQGWPVIEGNVDDMADKMGANYYVSVNYDDITQGLMKRKGFKIITATPKYVIIQLTSDWKLPKD